MSGLFDWELASDLRGQDPPFDALIMAAWLKADTLNRRRLTEAFPSLCREARRRQEAHGGRLPEDGGQ